MSDLTPRLGALTARYVAAYVRHARRPAVQGATAEHLRWWQHAYYVRASVNDGNPVFAAALLPNEGADRPLPGGLPLLPAGVRWAVDEGATGQVTVTVDLAASAGVSAVVTPLKFSYRPLRLTVDAKPTRTTITFAARADGLYQVALSTVGGPLATVLVPVQRRAFRLLREDARALGVAFRAAQPPLPTDAQLLRLALLAGAESAAQTGQAALSDTLRERAESLPAPATPTALYPFARG